MSMEPLTPALIQKVRAGVGPSEIGWSQSSYESLCRRHGIVPYAASMESHVDLDAPPKPKPIAPRPVGLLRLGVSVENCLAQRDGVTVYLNPTRTKVLYAFNLLSGGMPDIWLRGPDIAERVEVLRGAISHAVKALDKQLEPLGIGFEVRKGRGAGFRMIARSATATTRPIDHDLTFKIHRECASRASVIVKLGPGEIEALKALVELSREAAGYFTSHRIAKRAGFSRTGAIEAIQRLNEKIPPLAVTIETRTGIGGGYRFVDLLASKTP